MATKVSYETHDTFELPSFSQFYTSAEGSVPERRKTSYLDKLAEARETGRLSWPDGSRYEIIDAIAVGGMGAILRASDKESQREVAMKVMLRADTDSPAAKRFIREARIVANLEHPNIVPVHDIGNSPLGEPYFTMKWVQGENLADILYKVRRGDPEHLNQYDLPALLEIFMKICNGVAFAHSRNIVHLDLKPHNILVGGYGEVLVLDWGLAGLMDKDDPGDALSFTHGIGQEPFSARSLNYNYNLFTEDGTIKGTPGFMAPEQADGKVGDICNRSDVFSLGSILYMILTLRVPIVGENSTEILQHTIDGNFVSPGKRLYHQTVPIQLDAIVMKAMALDKKDRYESVESLQDDIRAYSAGFATSVEHAGLLKQIFLFLRRRKTEVSLIAAGVFMTVSLVIAFTIKLNFQTKETRKEKQTNKSILKVALAARNQASKNRVFAAKKKDEAKKATFQADFNAYVANIRLGELSIQRRRYDTAKQALADCPDSFRHWEWGRLKYLTHLDYLTIPFDQRVSAVCLSDDGRLAANAAGSKGVIITDAETGRIIKLLKRNESNTVSIDASGDLRRIIAGGRDGSAEIWDTDTGKLVHLLPGHNGPVSLVAIDDDGNRVITGSQAGPLVIWDGKAGKKIRSIKGHNMSLNSIDLSGDGGRLVGGGLNQTVKLWDTQSGRLLLNIKGHGKAITSIHIAGRYDLIVSGSRDDTVKIWHARTGRLLKRLRAQFNGVTAVDVSSDGRFVIGGGADFQSKIWDIRSGDLKTVLKGHSAPIESVSISGDGNKAVTASDDKTVKIWRVDHADEIGRLVGHADDVLALAISSDARLIATGSADKTAKVWSRETGALVLSLLGHTAAVTGLCFSDDGADLATASKDNTIRIWKLKSGRERLILRGHTDQVNSIAISHATRTIISGSHDHTARVWDAINGRLLQTLNEHTGPVLCVAITSDGKSLITVSEDQTMRIWDANTGSQIRIFSDFKSPLSAVTVNSRKSLLIVGDINGQISLRDMQSGETVRTLEGHWGRITDVALSSDDKRLISSSSDMTAMIWDVATGTELITLKENSGSINSVRFSPDSRQVISCGNSDQATIWNAAAW
jgi:WD40 repeat protein/serine/threonine protein kinase